MNAPGPVEALVLEAWGVGICIDTDVPAQQAKLVDLLDRARAGCRIEAAQRHSDARDCEEAMTDPKHITAHELRLTAGRCQDAAISIQLRLAADALDAQAEQIATLTERYECNTAIMHARTKAMNEAHTELASAKARCERMEKALRYCIDVIDHEVKPPESCGACGTPNAQCGGECADAYYFAVHMREARAALADETSADRSEEMP